MKKYKGLILGIFIGGTLMFSFQSFAEDGLQTISALLRTGLNVTLDGKNVTLDNPSINYNGSTYLKLRDMSKITGIGVNWNDKTQTVELSSVSGNVYGDVSQVQVTPAPTPNVSPVPDSSSTPSPTSDSNSNITYKGIYYNYAEVIKHLDSIHKPNEVYMTSRLLDKSGSLTRIVTYEGVEHVTLNKVDEFFSPSYNVFYRSQNFFLQFLTLKDLDGIQTYHYNSIQNKMDFD